MRSISEEKFKTKQRWPFTPSEGGQRLLIG
jgi:hypothetical protein